jgi:transposase-like protein
VPKPYSPAFKAKMVQRLTGPKAVSANQLKKEVGVPQGTLSTWLREARTLPNVPPKKPPPEPVRSVEDKARIVSEAGKLDGDAQVAYLQREGIRFAELEQWRLALADEGRTTRGTADQIRALQRELARKDKALAETAALLVLRKKAQALWGDEDDETDEENES